MKAKIVPELSSEGSVQHVAGRAALQLQTQG